MCVCTHTPSSGLVGLISQPAVVHKLPSVSAHGVLFAANMCVCTHTPSSCFFNDTSPTEIFPLSLPDALPILLVFGVHFPLVVSQTPLHSSAGGQTLALWFWSH